MMTRHHLRLIAVALIVSLIPTLSGCGGGIVETALVVKKLYGLWELYKLFDDGKPSVIQVARAVLKLDKTFNYSLSHFDDHGGVTAAETGTWDVDAGNLVLHVEVSTINPAAVGSTVRLSGRFADATANEVSLTQQVTEGGRAISREAIYRRATP